MSASACELPPGGTLVISLDFELHWGLREIFPVDHVRSRLLGARAAIPQMLEMFVDRGIRATWATVGLLFCESRDEAIARLPALLPQYDDPKLLLDPTLTSTPRSGRLVEV